MAEEEAKKPKEEKKAEKRGKRIRKGRKHEKQQVWKFYKVDSGKAGRIKQHCPRCGPGTWLGRHKSRATCGKCGYTEFEKK